jgi:rhodanese-related sulfurtransferase
MIAGKKVLIAVAATLCLGGTIWWAMPRDATTHDASWHGAVVAAKQGNYELMHTDEIRQLLEEAPQKILVIDVRQKEDYDAGHIPSAVNVPLHGNLLRWAGEKTRLARALGPDKTRYAIFSGADLSDALSDLAARNAVELGYNQVFRHAKGFSDWKGAGLRVSKTASEQSDTGDSLLRKPVVFGWAMIGSLLSIFFGGVALNLTPCVYPLVPITVSYFGTRQGQTRVALAAHGVLYVGGLAFTNSLLGVAASLTGGLMGSTLPKDFLSRMVQVK